MMTVEDIASASSSRSTRWHPEGIDGWSALEWAGAMAGEAGEACNAAKKLKRIDSSMATLNQEGRHYTTTLEARRAIAQEAADTILYAVLLIERVGFNLEDTLRQIFNNKSIEYGFPERL